jgi:tRNA wybutosine-synthesizing protein 1
VDLSSTLSVGNNTSAVIFTISTFYESNRCMEATPSLACANKCVFCWRHHTNPVAKSWQWKMDDPLEIVNSAIEQHTNMIKQMKGVPGKFMLFSFQK